MVAEPKKREIWFRFQWQGLLLRQKIVHWKGYVFVAVLFAAMTALYAVMRYAPQDFSGLLLFMALGGVMVFFYWTTLLDHSEWSSSKKRETTSPPPPPLSGPPPP